MKGRIDITRPAILAACACVLLLGAAGCAATTAGEPAETALVLITADGPLTTRPAPARPPLDLAAGELIMNSAIVPETDLQGVLHERLLFAEPVTSRRYSIIRWPARVTLGRHYHAATERVYMLEGSIASPADGEIAPGTFWEAPAGVAMGPFTSERGGTFIFLGEGPFQTVLLEDGDLPPDPDGRTIVVDPEAVPWQPLADVVPGATAVGAIRIVRPGTSKDRAVHLVRFDRAPAGGYASSSANIEGYVLRGELELSDPYHGTHVLGVGQFFRIPAGFPTNLFGSGSGT
ncbi:MAG TPA: DUF4437 domain-containing protein [Longimicrobiales bacterium]